MIYDKILGNYEYGGYDLTPSSIFVYYGLKIKGGTSNPSINYVASFDGSHIISGEFGKEWNTVLVDDAYGTNNNLTADFDTVYLCNNISNNKNIILPTTATAGCQLAVKFVGDVSKKVTIKVYGSPSIFKKTNSSTLYSDVVLDKHTPLCYLYYFNNIWIVTYQGINIYNNITPYWNTKLVTSNTAINYTDVVHNTRYVYLVHNNEATTVQFQLPKANTVHNNFRISIDTLYLDDYTTIKVISNNDSNQNDSQIILPNGSAVDLYNLNKTNKTVLFIKLLGSTYWFAIENDEEYWITRKITSNTAAKNRYRYVCSNTNGLEITLPKNPALYDRIAIFVQLLAAPNVVKVTSPVGGKVIQIGTTYIQPSTGSGNTNYLLIEANLIYVLLIYYDTYWHVIKLITPPNHREWKAGFGLKIEGTDTFVLTGSVDIPDNITLTSSIKSINNRDYNVLSAYNLYSRFSSTPAQNIQLNQLEGGITQISCMIPPPPATNGPYVLMGKWVGDTPVYLWVEIAVCSNNNNG